MSHPPRICPPRIFLSLSMAALVAGCSGPLDFDLRGKIGAPFNTADAAENAVAKRPEPDARGVISYPNYQVAVARRGDNVGDVAARVGLPAAELARFNGVSAKDSLRAGEVLALPRRVTESGTGPIRPADTDLRDVAGAAIDASAPTPVTTTTLAPARPSTALPQTGREPIRHKVERGETAYTVARLYNVPVKDLARWNGLGADFALREGQYLMIPVIIAASSAPATTKPGSGSPTPVPPSATKPLPKETPKPATAKVETPAAPKLPTTKASSGRMVMPVQGSVIREFSRGKNDGIDFSANAGAPVKAADSGVVAAVTADANNVPIVVIKHPKNVLSVYANLSGIKVKKDDAVSRGQTIATVGKGNPARLHFEVREGFKSVDPMKYLK